MIIINKYFVQTIGHFSDMLVSSIHQQCNKPVGYYLEWMCLSLSRNFQKCNNISMRCRAKESYIWIIFFAFGFDMTTPNSLNKQMMSSWSITPNQRRNAQNYKTDMDTASLHFNCTRAQMSVLRFLVIRDTFMGARVTSLQHCASCLAINKSKEWLPLHYNLEKTLKIHSTVQVWDCADLTSWMIWKSV